jgi:TonB family protein
MKPVVLALVVVMAACHAAAERALPPSQQDQASFFSQVKRKVAQRWDPNSVWRRVDPKGTVYGPHSRVTQLRVSLSPAGELARIDVIASSGSTELDDEAIRAFRTAAPFLDPPARMVERDDLITFDFALYYQVHPEYPARVAARTDPALEGGIGTPAAGADATTEP